MSCLGTSDPNLAFERLAASVSQLSERSAAILKLDYAIDLPSVLKREPVERESAWLGDRRAAYAELVARDPKTLSRWSNTAILELRALLINDTYSDKVYVVAAVRNRRTVGISHIINDEVQAAQASRRISTDFETDHPEPTPPLIVYAYPRDWAPQSVHLAVSFLDGDLPNFVRAFYADSFPELSTAPNQTEVEVVDGTAACAFKNPTRNHLYALWWTY